MRSQSANLKAFAILFLLVYGCRPLPEKAYEKLHRMPVTDPLAQQDASRLELGRDFASRLRNSDPVLVVNDSVPMYSHYRNFAVALESGHNYTLSISALCACSGHRKQMFVPVIFVSDEKGRPAPITFNDTSTADSRFGTLSVNNSYIVRPETTGVYRVTVFAANSSPGASLDSLLGSAQGIGAGLTGRFHLKIEPSKP